MEKLLRVMGFIDQGLNSIAMYQEWQARRDLMGETNYLQGALQIEREEMRVLRTELQQERSKNQLYTLLLFEEGYLIDVDGKPHKLSFEDDEDDEEGTETSDQSE